MNVRKSILGGAIALLMLSSVGATAADATEAVEPVAPALTTATEAVAPDADETASPDAIYTTFDITTPTGAGGSAYGWFRPIWQSYYQLDVRMGSTDLCPGDGRGAAVRAKVQMSPGTVYSNWIADATGCKSTASGQPANTEVVIFLDPGIGTGTVDKMWAQVGYSDNGSYTVLYTSAVRNNPYL